MPSQNEGSKPLIVILTLDKQDFYDQVYADFNKLLKSHAQVEYATTPDEARAFFNRTTNKPAAILSADESLTVSTRLTLVHEAASYVQSGGTLVLMGLFSSSSRPSDIGLLFSKLDQGGQQPIQSNLRPSDWIDWPKPVVRLVGCLN
jgi:hypothetical protein